ncbi:MAG: helix-turn-helix domain-containing protein [Rhodospirillales bacterium]
MQSEITLRRERSAPLPTAFAFSLRDAAKLSGLSVATLRRREADGLFRFHHIGGRTLIRRADLLRLCGAADEAAQ